jgi:hypothetical protein
MFELRQEVVMSNRRFSQILDQWEEQRSKQQELVTRSISIKKTDVERLKALAEVYSQPMESIMADLMHAALAEAESSIPYVPGSKVIRVEDGEPCYEDDGKMPDYLDARQRAAHPDN